MSPGSLAVGLETSGPMGGVALGEGGRQPVSQSLTPGMHHARDLVPTLGRLAKQHDLVLSRLQVVMVDLGPGSFTGLRVGVAVTKALHLATRCEVVGVVATDAVVAALPQAAGRACVVIDATRGELYAARYEVSAQTPTPAKGRFSGAAATWQRTSGPTILKPAQLLDELTPGCLVAGAGLKRYGDEFRSAGFALAPESAWLPTAEWVYTLGWERYQAGLTDDPYRLEPIYLRLPAAEERWRARRGFM